MNVQNPNIVESGYPEGLLGKEVVSVQQLKGTFYIFTKDAIYTLRQPRWYDPIVNFFRRFTRWTQKLTKS